MKTPTKFLLIILPFIFAYGFSGGDGNKTDDFRKLENKAFKEGEKLTFDLNYGFVTAGVAVMQIPKIKRISGREAYHINFEVNSVPSFVIG